MDGGGADPYFGFFHCDDDMNNIVPECFKEVNSNYLSPAAPLILLLLTDAMLPLYYTRRPPLLAPPGEDGDDYY